MISSVVTARMLPARTAIATYRSPANAKPAQSVRVGGVWPGSRCAATTRHINTGTRVRSCGWWARPCPRRQGHYLQCILTPAVAPLLEVAFGAGHLVGHVRIADSRLLSRFRKGVECGGSYFAWTVSIRMTSACTNCSARISSPTLLTCSRVRLSIRAP